MPISSIWDEGFVDVLVKIFRKEQAAGKPIEDKWGGTNETANATGKDEGNFSEFLEKLKENDPLLLGGPFGKLYYEGGGNFFFRPDK